MGKPNLGKKFESRVEEGFLAVPYTDVQRLYDTTNGYVGISQPADFIIYHKPTMYYVECKCTWANTLHKDCVTQLPKLLIKDSIEGVRAIVIIWFISHDITIAIEASDMAKYFENGHKSINVRHLDEIKHTEITAKKRRTFFDYDFTYLMFN